MKITNGLTITPYLRLLPDKNNKFPIQIRITENRKTNFKTIGYSIARSHWNENKNELRISCPDYEKINRLINDKIEEIKKEKELKIKPEKNKSSFSEYLNHYIDYLSESNRIADMKKHIVVKNYLFKFKNNNDIKFLDIDKQFLNDLRLFFIKIPTKPNTYRSYFKKIRKLYYQASGEDYFIPIKNPFETFKYDKIIVSNKSLTMLEFTKVHTFNSYNLYFRNEGIDLNDEFLNFHKNQKLYLEYSDEKNEKISETDIKNLFDVKNFFCFQIFARGMRVADLITLKWDKINNNKIEYQMRKTKVSVRFDIIEQMIFLLRFYVPFKYKKRYYEHLKNNRLEFDIEMYLSLFDQEKKIIKEFFDKKGKKTSDKEIENFYKKLYHIENLDFKYLLEMYDAISKNQEFKDDYIFPFISKEKRLKLEKEERNLRFKKEYNLIQSNVAMYNKQLKLINKHLQIKTNITSHLARHTYTSIQRFLGADVNIISQSLAHGDLSMTQKYIKTFDDDTRVDDENKKYFEIMNISSKKMVEENKNSVILKISD